ncbi:MAG: SpoIIE family protein phosphatase [Spirochaetes bacterium]|nr:SpoIIE family protein phosphatase [Spirochaetota bacterium]
MPVSTVESIIYRLHEPLPMRFTAGMLVSSMYYVFSDTKIDALSEALAKNEDIFACAVVDRSMKVHGVIVRKDLFDILGRRFGRELYYNKTALDMIQRVQSFPYNIHVFECAKIIERDLLTGVQDYYVLLDDNGCYSGIFSTKDMLIFLSRLTRIDIDQAKRIISRIIKKEYIIKTKRLHIAVRTEMVQDIGGDSYYVLSSKSKNQHVIAVCDVSGKGIAASMITTLISGMISSYDFEKNSIEYFLIQLNNFIYTTFEGERFVTACFMLIDEDSGMLNMYDFGHSMTYLLRNNNMFKLSLKEINIPLGIQKMHSVNGGRAKIEPGDTIIAFTDGIIEQRNIEGKEYGVQRLNKLIIDNNTFDPMNTINAAFDTIKNYKGRYPQQDDMTLLCIRYE